MSRPGLFFLAVVMATIAMPRQARAADLVEFARENGLTKLANLIEEAGLEGDLSELTNGTIIAPTNEAFSLLLNATAAAGVELTPEDIVDILKYHVLPEAWETSSLPDSEEVALDTLLEGSKISIYNHGAGFGVFADRDDSEDFVLGEIVQPDVMVPDTDIIVQVVDGVIVPAAVWDKLGLP